MKKGEERELTLIALLESRVNKILSEIEESKTYRELQLIKSYMLPMVEQVPEEVQDVRSQRLRNLKISFRNVVNQALINKLKKINKDSEQTVDLEENSFYICEI